MPFHNYVAAFADCNEFSSLASAKINDSSELTPFYRLGCRAEAGLRFTPYKQERIRCLNKLTLFIRGSPDGYNLSAFIVQGHWAWPT